MARFGVLVQITFVLALFIVSDSSVLQRDSNNLTRNSKISLVKDLTAHIPHHLVQHQYRGQRRYEPSLDNLNTEDDEDEWMSYNDRENRAIGMEALDPQRYKQIFINRRDREPPLNPRLYERQWKKRDDNNRQQQVRPTGGDAGSHRGMIPAEVHGHGTGTRFMIRSPRKKDPNSYDVPQIDVAIPNDNNVGQKEIEKRTKYRDLTFEIQRIWKKRATVIPIVIGALGVVTPDLQKLLERLELEEISTAALQKTALLGTAYILRRYLDNES